MNDLKQVGSSDEFDLPVLIITLICDFVLPGREYNEKNKI